MRFVSTHEFKDLAKVGRAGDLGVHKEVLVKADPAGPRRLTFTISDNSIDRMGDTIAIDGWDLANYAKNPVVLFAHNSRDLPIAKATKVWRDGNRLRATAEFVPADLPVAGPLAEAVYQLYLGGFLNATSVGMLPKKWAWSKDESRPYGIDFLEHELLEFSAVPIPANANALIERPAAGKSAAARGGVHAFRHRQIEIARLRAS